MQQYLFRYDYIAILDIDEVIVPRFPHRNWHDIMANLTAGGKYSYYYFLNYYLLEETLERKGYDKSIPEHLYMLQNIHRSAEHTPDREFQNFSVVWVER